ncbi:DUF6796 family protein [Pseudonocardia sp. TRM90224]|uniref:DUF6796 family protein n=1 Tax=Pseudonocardia sp. TRM90224 TaxID=2812678 RepID=UPI001E5E9B58|nr:DUF6796 family protein [Pseudonocardia sp. TRM90224]
MSVRRNRLVRWAGLAGVAASLSYIAGDVLLFGAKAEPDEHPELKDVPGAGREALWMVPSSTNRLVAGAMAGVLPTPLYLAAVWHLYTGLEPAGRRRALPPALVMAAGWTWASFIHGSYAYAGEAWKALEDSAPSDPAVRARLIAQARTAARITGLSYVPFAATTLAASTMIVAAVRTGETAYPRWAAPLVAPAVPIGAAVALTASHVLPGAAGHRFQGSGISIGHLVSFAASTALLWSGRRAARREV